MTLANSQQNIVKSESSALRQVWRYGPLVLWMIIISIASTAEFSAENTSRFLGPLVRWLFPNITDSRMAALHFLMRKAGHFTEYAVLGFLARRAFVTSANVFLQRRWFELGLLLLLVSPCLTNFIRVSYRPGLLPFTTARSMWRRLDRSACL